MAGDRADIREYLVVHKTLRTVLDRFVQATDRLDAPRLAAVVGERWALFSRGLHHHHEEEDTVFFPMIVHADPSTSELIEQLEREHRELVARLDEVDAAIAALEAAADDATKRRVHDAIAAVRDELVPHLDIEDAQLLPAAAASVDGKAWKKASEQALRSTPKQDLPVVAGAMDEVVRSLPRDQWPPAPPIPVRVLLAVSWRKRYQQFVEPLIT